MDSIILKARAKINIGLDVIGKREDGYHEMRMVMQTLSMYDRLVMNKLKEDDISVSTNLSYVPANENNLAYRAARLMKDEYGISGGVDINLNKYIPVSAGMAGGSSDAAAVLIGMNKLFDLGLSMEELMKQGVKLGADVPYCIMRGTVLAEGIGEKLTKLPAFPKCYVVVAKPAFSVSTKMVFTNLRLDEITEHPDIDGIVRGIEKADLGDISSCMGNVLETVTIKQYPLIAELKEIMLKKGAINSLMSGSGPTVFGLFDDIKTAKRAYYAVLDSRKSRQTFLTEIFNV